MRETGRWRERERRGRQTRQGGRRISSKAGQCCDRHDRKGEMSESERRSFRRDGGGGSVEMEGDEEGGREAASTAISPSRSRPALLYIDADLRPRPIPPDAIADSLYGVARFLNLPRLETMHDPTAETEAADPTVTISASPHAVIRAP
ncbi:hypothetical protein ACLOJK_017187 [Asimina triloba]